MQADTKAVHNRLRRIEGQVRGLQRMVDEDAYCVDILTQVAAVQTALEQVAVNVLDAHVRHCVADAVAGDGPQADEKLDELMTAVRRFAKVRCRRRLAAARGFQHSSRNAAISSVSRSGARRSSTIELACSSRPFGSSSASMPASENGWIMSNWWPITSVGASNVRRSSRCGAVRPKNRPWMTAALGSGSWRTQSSRMSACHGSRRAGTSRAVARHEPGGRGAERQPQHQRRERDRGAEQRVVEHGHLDHHAAQALGRQRGDLERRVGAQRGAHHHRLVDLEVVEQRHHLAAELGHRVAPHVGRPVGLAVAEQVERQHAMAALGQRPGERVVHVAAEQQAVQQHDDARPLAVGAVGQRAAGVREAAVGAFHVAAF